MPLRSCLVVALLLAACGANPSASSDTGSSSSADTGPASAKDGSAAPDRDGGTAQASDGAVQDPDASTGPGTDGGTTPEGDASTASVRQLEGTRVLGEGGFFGTSARDLGKVNATDETFAIGAHYANLPGATGTDKAGGRVYLFRKAGGIPANLSAAAEILEPPDLAVQGGFGYALGNPCDLDGDGFLDLPIGSHLYSNSSTMTATGRVVVFWGDLRGSFSPMRTSLHTLAAGVMAKSDCFGQTVQCADFNADGVGDLLATGQNAGPSDTGIGALFYGKSGTRLAANPDSLIAPTLAVKSQYFGSASLFEDLDGDGVRDLAVGAWGLIRGGDVAGPHTGGFSIFKGGTDWASGPTFQVTPGGSNQTHLGSQLIAFSTPTASFVAATAPSYDAEGGAVLVYKTGDATLSQGVPVHVLRPAAGMVAADSFASGLAYVPDYFGKDKGALLVGAKYAAAGAVASAGAIAVFPTAESGLGFVESASILTAPEPVGGDGFGSTIAALGDLDGDGLGDFVVGIPEHLEGDVYTGTQTGGVVFFH
ncbi:MAG TPA: VCBS repeat-containing protein [Myxococcales bacterium]